MDRLRTLGIVAHIDAGKTTLTEHILRAAGRQSFVGAVDDGTATMDWMRQEQERGISIQAAATSVRWRECELQIVDTPGHVDFTAEVERSLRVLDGLVVVIDGVRGVESQTRTVWRHADRWRCARLAFVNKLDRAGADFAAATRSLRDAFECRTVPLVVPLHDDDGAFAGLGHALHGHAQWFAGELPPNARVRCARELQAARDAVVEQCADLDEAILADFVAGRTIATERLLRALRGGCIRGEIVPVLAGAALLDRGVEWLLDAVCDLLPSPVDRLRTGMVDAFPLPDAAAPVCALVFKVEHSAGEVHNYLRVFRGTLRAGTELVVARTGQVIATAELWAMHAARHERAEAAVPGAIVVLPRVPELQTGDTVHERACQHVLPRPAFSSPVIAARVEPATAIDLEPLQVALRELQADDPTLHIERDADTGLPLMLGMGELHLEIVAERLRERGGFAFAMSRPRVALRGGVRDRGAATVTLQAQGGESLAAAVTIAIAATEPGAPLEIDLGAQAQQPFAAALEQALRNAATASGSPIEAVRVTVGDLILAGSGPAVEALLMQAAAYALAKAIEQAGAVVLEPMVTFEIRCPLDRRAAVHADLASRGAMIRQVSAGQLGAVLLGRGRLAAFLGYSTRLRSITQGQGEAQLQPDGRQPVADARDAD